MLSPGKSELNILLQ